MKFFLVLLFIPFLASVGHDIYLNYLASDEQRRDFKSFQVRMQDFKASDLGWVWREYSPNSFNGMRDSMNIDTWQTYVDPVLRNPTMLVAATPFVLGAVLSFVYSFLFTPISMSSSVARNRDQALGRGKQAKQMKFSRK
ncbi:MAG: hypothetical protein AAF549_00090 [Pseudomonadota bacterium]